MPHHGGASVVYDDPLHHATAYTGFDAQKQRFSNYFLCTGVLDNVPAQLAFDYVEANPGGHLHMEDGDYAFAVPVTGSFSDFLLSGAGKDTVITYLGNAEAIRFFATSEIVNITVRDIKFVGNPADNENELLAFDYVDGYTVEDCFFEDSGDEGIAVGMPNGPCRNGVIRANHFVNCPAVDTSGAAIGTQCGHLLIEENIIEGGVGAGITLEALSEIIEKVEVVNNILKTPGERGVGLSVSNFNIQNVTISENQIYAPTLAGITDNLGGTEKCLDIKITNNIIDGGGTDAAARGAINITKNTPERVDILGNTVKNWDPANGDKSGIVGAILNGKINDNTIYNVGDDGIKATGDYMGVHDNIIKMAGQGGAGIRAGIELVTGSGIHCTDNTVEGSKNGIRVTSGAGHTVKHNKLVNITTFIFTDAGIGTELETKVFQFTEPVGTAAWQVASPTGILVDAADEGALAEGEAPLEVQMVVRFRVKGVCLAATGAGKGMLLELIINAGKPVGSEAYNAEAIGVVNVISTEDDVAINDAIEWIIDATDDVDVDDIMDGETIEMFGMFEDGGANGDIATDALLRTISIEYV